MEQLAKLKAKQLEKLNTNNKKQKTHLILDEFSFCVFRVKLTLCVGQVCVLFKLIRTRCAFTLSKIMEYSFQI